MKRFVAVLERGSGGTYGVSFPDFPGCITVGKGLRDAQAMAREALALHVAGMLEDGEAIPRPASPVSVRKDPFYRKMEMIFVVAPVGIRDRPRSVA